MNRKILTILITLFLFPILTVFAFVNPYNIPCKNSLPGFVQSNAVIGQVPTKQSNGLWAPAIPGNMNTSVWDADTNGAIDAAAGGTNKILWTLYSIPFLSGTTIFDQIPIGTAGQYLQVNAGANGYTWGSGGSPAFNAITTGTNTTAAMTCGTGCSIVPSGTGDVTATSLLAAYIDWNGTDGASILNKPSLLPVPASPTSGSLYQYITSAWDKSAFTFPTSITAGDLFYGSSANVIGAIAKGGNNSVFGINGFGVQGYLTQFASDDSAYNFFNVTDITKRGQFNLSALSASTTITVDWPTVAGTMCDTGAVCTGYQAALTYPVTGVISPTAGMLTKWGASGDTLADGLKLGTLTDTKYCIYSTASGLVCNSDSGAMVYPGAGVANSTGTAWGTSYTTTGSGTVVALSASPTLVTPVIGAATGTSLIVTGVVDGLTNVVLTTSTTNAVESPEKLQIYTFNNFATAATAVAYTLPTAAAGKQRCYGNYTGKTGTITINTSAAGQYIDMNGTQSATGGYVVSGGALGDKACFVGITSTVWIMYTQRGTWTLH